MSRAHPSLSNTVRLELLATGLNTPIAIRSVPFPGSNKNMLVVATHSGQLYRVDNGQKILLLDLANTISTASTIEEHSKGLLGLAFHSDFINNGLFYVYYSGSDINSSPPFITPDPCQPLSWKQTWTNRALYSHVNTIEEWRWRPFGTNPVQFENTILRIRWPFTNNNGRDALSWDRQHNRLLVATGDGGGLYDPFNLAQNDNELLGKVLSLNIIRLRQWAKYRTEPVSRLSDIEEAYRNDVLIVAKGIRSSTAPISENIGNRFIRYLAQVGEVGQESGYSWDAFPVNLGWRAWEGSWPTTFAVNCDSNNNTSNNNTSNNNTSNNNTSNNFASSSSNLSNNISHPLVTIHWNSATNQLPDLILSVGQQLRLRASDGLRHGLTLSAGPPSWKPMNWNFNYSPRGNFDQIISFATAGTYYLQDPSTNALRLKVMISNNNGSNNNSNSNNSNVTSFTNTETTDIPLSLIAFPLELSNLYDIHKPIISYDHRGFDQVGGLQITGIRPFRGSSTWLQDGVIISEAAQIVNNQAQDTGLLAYVTLIKDQLQNRRQLQAINIVNWSEYAGSITCLGSDINHTELYCGVNHLLLETSTETNNNCPVTNGSIFRIVPLN